MDPIHIDGVPLDRVWFVMCLLLRIQEQGPCKILYGDHVEHAISVPEMDAAIAFLVRLGFVPPTVVLPGPSQDDSRAWDITPT